MAKIRITADLYLDTADTVTRDQIKTSLLALKTKFQNINIGLSNEEKSTVTWHICRHDEGKPCEEKVIVI